MNVVHISSQLTHINGNNPNKHIPNRRNIPRHSSGDISNNFGHILLQIDSHTFAYFSSINNKLNVFWRPSQKPVQDFPFAFASRIHGERRKKQQQTMLSPSPFSAFKPTFSLILSGFWELCSFDVHLILRRVPISNRIPKKFT